MWPQLFWKPSARFEIRIHRKLREFVHYKTKPVLELLGVCEQLFLGGFDDNFSGYPENWLRVSCHRKQGESQNAQGRRLSLPPAKGNVWNRLRFLKKQLMFLEELNRGIRENGIMYLLAFQADILRGSSRVSAPPWGRNTWPTPALRTSVWEAISTSFKTFPGCLITATKHSYFAFFPDFSHLFSDSDHRDPRVPLTFFPAATLVVYHIPTKNAKKTMFWLNTR